MAPTPKNVRLVDDDGRVMDLDESTFVQKFLDYIHSENHGGRVFGAWKRATIGSAGQIRMSFANPTSAAQIAASADNKARELHLVFKVSGLSGAGFVAAYDNCSLDPGSLGVAFVPHNHNHGSANASVGSCYIDAMFQNTGDQADFDQFGSGQTGSGEARGEAEHIIPPGQCFSIILESEAATNPCLLKTVHYEHARKRQ